MTILADREAQRLNLIHETGYWRVVIHPTQFEELRVPSLPACWKIVEAAHVSLRGWDYPSTDRKERTQGADWIQSSTAFANHVELWRLYQSGQFVHHFSLREDRELPGLVWRGQEAPIREGPRALNWVSTVYTLTEILEFARGLAYRHVLEPAATIRVELHGMKARQLSAPGDRMPVFPHHSSFEDSCWKRTVQSAELIADAAEAAIDASIHVFENFGWENPPRDLLAQEQRRLLGRRL